MPLYYIDHTILSMSYMSKEIHADKSQEGDKSNIKDYEPELDFIIEKLTKRVKWYLSKLESLEEDIQASNKTSDAFNKLASLLVKFLQFKGYKFDVNVDQEHIFDLLQKLESRQKKIEETKE